MSAKNHDLANLHQLLGELLDDLVEQQEASSDPNTIRALAREIREVAFRITMVQQLLFKQQTDKITKAVKKVEDAKADLAKAIAKIDRLNDLIKGVSAFLGLVDKVIDLAKLL